MKNAINIDPLLKSKKNTINILNVGGRRIGNEYIPGTVYAGFVSVNLHGMYRQEVIPESIYINGHAYKTSDGHGYMDITNNADLTERLHESVFFPVKKFPFDISMDYKGGNKLTMFTMENDNNEVEVHAYQTLYVKPLIKCEKLVLGSGHRALYALNSDNEILAVVMPWPLRADSPLQSFISESAISWFKKGDEALAGFEENLQAAIQQSKQYYDEKNKARIEADIKAREQRRIEQEIEEAVRLGNIIKNMSIPNSEILGSDLIEVARSLNIILHPRTVGSIRKRVCKIIIGENGGFGMSFYRTKDGAGISNGVKRAIWKIINTAKEQGLGNDIGVYSKF